MNNSVPLADQENKGHSRTKTNEDDIDYSSLLRNRARVSRTARPPLTPRTTLWVLALAVFGAVFLILGISEYTTSIFRMGGDASIGLSMVVLGALMFVPGSYGSWIIYGTYRGWSGYSYNQIPNYDDD